MEAQVNQGQAAFVNNLSPPSDHIDNSTVPAEPSQPVEAAGYHSDTSPGTPDQAPKVRRATGVRQSVARSHPDTPAVVNGSLQQTARPVLSLNPMPSNAPISFSQPVAFTGSDPSNSHGGPATSATHSRKRQRVTRPSFMQQPGRGDDVVEPPSAGHMPRPSRHARAAAPSGAYIRPSQRGEAQGSVYTPFSQYSGPRTGPPAFPVAHPNPFATPSGVFGYSQPSSYPTSGGTAAARQSPAPIQRTTTQITSSDACASP